MAQHFWQPVAGDVGLAPASWAVPWVLNNYDGEAGTPVTVADQGGGVYAMTLLTGSSNRLGVSWQSLGTLQDVEVYCRMKLVSGVASSFGPVIMWAFSGGTANFNNRYMVKCTQPAGAGTSVEVYRYEYSGGAADEATLSGSPLTTAVGVELGVRIRRVHSTNEITFKAWKITGAGDLGESAALTGTITDSSLTTAGYVGLGNQSSLNAVVYCVGVGTAGDAAPTSSGGGGSSTTPPPFPRFNYAILNH